MNLTSTVWNIIGHYSQSGNILEKKGKNPSHPKLVSKENKRN